MRQVYFSGSGTNKNGAQNTNTTAGIGLNWTFFDGFKMFATDRKLDALETNANFNLAAEMEMKIYQASILFYTIVQQKELNKVYLDALQLSKARYELALLKKNNGAASEVELIQARLDLTADSSVYLNGLKTLDNLKADCNLLLARDPSLSFEGEGNIDNNTALNWESINTRSKEQNTSLLLAKSNIAIREKERKEAASFFYPKLSLFAQYNFTHSKNQAGFMLSNMTYGPTFGISLQWNILDNLSKFTATKNSKIALENATIAQEQQELTIQTELRKSFNEYEWAKRNLQMEQANIDESNLNFSIAEDAFKAGSINSLQLREMQFSVVQAKSRYIVAQLACKTAELNLSLMVGDFKTLLVRQ
jgi:outer membrane protein TolC